MFVCSICRKVTQPRVPQHKLTFYKEVVHPVRFKPVFTKQGQPVYRWHKGLFPKERIAWSEQGQLMEIIDWGGKGKQIAKEIATCPECKANH